MCSQGGDEGGVKEEAAGRVFENARDAMLYACFNDVGGCFGCGVTLLDAVKGSWGEIGEPQDVGFGSNAAPCGPGGPSPGLAPAVARSSEPSSRHAMRGHPSPYEPLNARPGNVTVTAELDVKP